MVSLLSRYLLISGSGSSLSIYPTNAAPTTQPVSLIISKAKLKSASVGSGIADEELSDEEVCSDEEIAELCCSEVLFDEEFSEEVLLRQYRTITGCAFLRERKAFSGLHRLLFFCHLAQILLERRQPSCAQFIQSDEKKLRD